jgi:DNA-nicking Smr family endonuclease
VQDSVLKKLKRGEYRVEAVCDLHGLRAVEAKEALREFLAESLAHNLRCVRVIHGKGMGSGPRGPVLKVAVNMILRKTAPVLAFTSARRVDGGTGAINVLLSNQSAGNPQRD